MSKTQEETKEPEVEKPIDKAKLKELSVRLSNLQVQLHQFNPGMQTMNPRKFQHWRLEVSALATQLAELAQ